MKQFLVFLLAAVAAKNSTWVYINSCCSSTEDHIFTYSFDPTTGVSTPLSFISAGQNPSFMALNAEGSLLIATNEINTFEGKATGAVQSFRVDANGGLSFVNRITSGGFGPTHVAVVEAGVAVANVEGSFATLGLSAQGVLSSPSSVQRSENGDARGFGHQVVPGRNLTLLAVDLALDRVLQFRLKAGQAGPILERHSPPFVQLSAGQGPRHLVVHPDRPVAYVVNEFGSSVTTVELLKDGFLGNELAIQSSLGDDNLTCCVDFRGDDVCCVNFPAEIVLHPNGNHLYVSNRGNNSIAHWNIDPSGLLTFVELTPSGGDFPRHFALSPDAKFMLVANQRSDSVITFSVDSNGRLGPSKVPPLPVNGPQCIVFRSVPDPVPNPQRLVSQSALLGVLFIGILIGIVVCRAYWFHNAKPEDSAGPTP